MAYPVANSPMFPSTSDVPFLPPKVKDMAIFNSGTHTYLCEDGITRVLTENQAINIGISCKVVGPSLMGPRYPVMNLR